MLRGALTIAAFVVVGAACEEEAADPTLPLLERHAGVTDPANDSSNKYIGRPEVIALGKKLYFDPHFSGRVVLKDMLLRTMTTPGRAGLGEPVNASCNTCHDVSRGGTDHETGAPSHAVSMGGGAYDVNSQQSINSAHYALPYWNGRNDSLWSQIVAVVESHVSVNGSRMRVAWRIVDKYKAEYQAAFPEFPLPAELDDLEAQKARLEADGTCKLDANNECPAAFCHDTHGVCLPKYPLDARPGFVEFGQLAECDWGNVAADDLEQPYGDAWDCMPLEPQRLATRIYVNFAKAIAAYEYVLNSKDSPFDRWADAGFTAGGLGPAAERGARLFVGKAACNECHSGPNFTDSAFHNIGVPQLGTYVPTTQECPPGGWCDCTSDDTQFPQNCLPWGARDGLRKLRANRFRRDSEWSDDVDCRSHFQFHNMQSYAEANPDECDGRVKYYSLPLDDSYKGQWRTPNIRDVALTPPYMHNGMYTTLREVVEHYNLGGVHGRGGETVGVLDTKIKPLNLTAQEIDDLVAFLETLTGQVDPAVTEPPVVPAASAF